MDEDLPHVVEALRGTVCVGVAFGTEWKKYRHGTATAEPMTQAVNSGARCYVDHYGSGFFFHETGLVLTCEHVRRACRRDINAHAGVLVVCPYKGPGTTLDWSEAWKAEVVAHTANWNPTDTSSFCNLARDNHGHTYCKEHKRFCSRIEDCNPDAPEDPSVRTLPGHDDAAVLRITSSLSTGVDIVRPITVGSSPLKILRLSETPLNALQQLASLGFPPVGGSVTPTPIVVRFSEKFDGTFLKLTGSEMMRGHSGGPLVTRSGVVVGWNVRNRDDVKLYSHCKMITVARECIELTLPAGVTWSSLLASPSVGWFGKGRAVLTSLLDKAGLSGLSAWLHPRIREDDTEQLTLEDVELRVGDRIVAEVAVGFFFYFRTEQWPARLQRWDAQSGMAEVSWDAKPELGWDAKEGNARFVLTQQGPRLYDEDEELYYKWRPVAPDTSARSAEVDEVQGAGGSWFSRLWALGRLFLLVVGALYVGYHACRLLLVPLMCCMVSLLKASLNHPGIVLRVFIGLTLLYLLRIGIMRALCRFVSEDENYDETHDETSNEASTEISDETTEAAKPKRAQRSPKRKRPKRS